MHARPTRRDTVLTCRDTELTHRDARVLRQGARVSRRGNYTKLQLNLTYTKLHVDLTYTKLHVDVNYTQLHLDFPRRDTATHCPLSLRRWGGADNPHWDLPPCSTGCCVSGQRRQAHSKTRCGKGKCGPG